MEKTRKFFLPVILAAVPPALAWYFRPMPLDALLDEKSPVSISCQTLFLREDGEPDFRFRQYSLEPGTAESQAAAAA